MSKEKLQKVTAEVSEECIMSLRILAIKSKMHLKHYVANVLEKHIESKKKIVGLHEETI